MEPVLIDARRMDGPEIEYDVLIVGAGIVGTALAYHLTRRPGLLVGVVDQAGVGAGSTRQGAGILTYQGWGAWDLGLVRESAEEYRRLTESRGRGGFRVTGGIRVARTADGAAWVDRVSGVLETSGVDGRTLSSEEVRDRIPWGAFDDIVGALYTPDDAIFSSLEIAGEYSRLSQRAGAFFASGTGPVEIERSDGAWTLRSSSGAWCARSIVVAAGASTPRLLRRVGASLPLAPFRSQAVRLRSRPLAGEFATLHDLDLDVYVRPEVPGRVIVGDGTERREADPDRWSARADVPFVSRVVHDLRSIAPGWTRLTAEIGWAGLCVASPDRYPLVGRVPGMPGLYVASGFNGLGAMRAAALARRLADGIRDGTWDALEPADPGRLLPEAIARELRPEFPLEAAEPEPPRYAADSHPTMVPQQSSESELPIAYRRLESAADVDGLALPSLSDWFDPLLKRFLADAIRVAGTVEVAEEDGEVLGVFLTSPTEDVASVFTRVRGVAEHYLALAGKGGIYIERPWLDEGEPIEILAADLRDWEQEFPIRNPVRLATDDDVGRVRTFMQTIAGDVDEQWLRSLPRSSELCFVCEIDGKVAGVSWASVVGAYARGHSFMVHPRYRGLGVGTDLLHARMIWLRDAGVVQVVSEIYEGNLGSRTAAERAGMAVVGRMYHFREPARTRA